MLSTLGTNQFDFKLVQYFLGRPGRGAKVCGSSSKTIWTGLFANLKKPRGRGKMVPLLTSLFQVR